MALSLTPEITHLRNEAPIIPEQDIPDINDFWERQKSVVVFPSDAPYNSVGRVMEYDLKALPPGGIIEMSMLRWLEISGGIKDPVRYLCNNYGSSIFSFVTKHKGGQPKLTIQKMSDEALFLKESPTSFIDPFLQKHVIKWVPVSIGDYWFTVNNTGKVRKFKVLKYNEDTRKFTMQDMAMKELIFETRPMRNGCIPYGRGLRCSNGVRAFPYNAYYDKQWLSEDIKRKLWYLEKRYEVLFAKIGRLKGLRGLDKIAGLLEEAQFKVLEHYMKIVEEEKSKKNSPVVGRGEQVELLALVGAKNQEYKPVD